MLCALYPGHVDRCLTSRQRFLKVQEDPWNDGTSFVASPGTRVDEVNPPGRDGIAIITGLWETSGIVEAFGTLAENSWLLDVRADDPTTPPTERIVADGQLVLMRRG